MTSESYLSASPHVNRNFEESPTVVAIPVLNCGCTAFLETHAMNLSRYLATVTILLGAVVCGFAQNDENPARQIRLAIADLQDKPTDYPEWLLSPLRNNVVESDKIPVEWDIHTGKNVLWSAKLGSENYGNPIVANGKVYVGTNNGSGYVARYPSTTDLGVLLCFDEKTGQMLWQHSNEKLPTGRVNDWPDQGVCSTPMIDGDRLWYVSNRGEVVCLDTEGFRDGQNDGPYTEEPNQNSDEADVVWKLNMMKELGVFQHNMCNCSVTCAGKLLFVTTSNGVDEGHVNVPAEKAPSFICLDRYTGKVIWTDNSPGKNILHGQWSSPAYAVLDGVPQVIFGGGDGWLYSFAPEGDGGKSKMLWKFDCNPKMSKYRLGPTATRNHIIGTPVVYDGLVYVAVGEDPEHGEGDGHLWCIDPTKRGDVSPTQVFNSSDPTTPIAPKRLQACVPEDGDVERDNPNHADVWHYEGNDPSDFDSTMHRTIGSAAIKNNLLFIADYSGLFHCIDAKTGKAYWTHETFGHCWSTPLIVNDRVYIGNEDGTIFCFKVDKNKQELSENSLDTAVFTTPIVANDTLFIANRNHVFALQEGAQSTVEVPTGN